VNKVGHQTDPSPDCTGGKVSLALTQSHSVAHSLTFCFSLILSSVFSPPRFPTHLGVVQRARPSFNPKGTCPRWAKRPAAPGGAIPHTRQFHSTIEVGERERYIEVGKVSSRARSCTLLSHLQMHFRFFYFFPFSSLLLNLLEVLQRARPSFNPKGTCPRWAKSPAAPGGAKSRTLQFHSTVEVEECYLVFALANIVFRARFSKHS
jgi:hypothetical protein